MKCVSLKEAGIDICVTVEVKPIFRHKASGELEQELERLETTRILRHLGVRHEGPLAREIARAFKERDEKN